MAHSKRGDLSKSDAPRPARPKTVTTPQVIYQIHGLILEGLRISTKLIAEHLGISRERFWSIIHDVENAEAFRKMGHEMPRRGSTVPVVRAYSGIFLLNPKDFLSRLVTLDEISLYYYVTDKKQNQ